MAYCNVCHTSNPEGAVVCQACKARLNGPDAGGQAPRRGTLVESSAPSPVRKPTIDEGDRYGMPGAMTGPTPGFAPGHRSGGMAPVRRATEFNIDPQRAESAARAGAKPGPEPGKVRRIVGVLITYTWTDQGQVFPLFEGRNRIGRDPSQCEIAIPQDESLSNVNSHIIYRKNFVIGDEVSMNGTYVDGEPVETQYHPLRNYAQVRTGATVWTFIAIQPAPTGGTEAAAE